MKRAAPHADASRTGQTWNADTYAEHGRFVADLAGGVVTLLAARPSERILDIGCGDGALTEQLASTGALLTGIDPSPEMIEAARARNLDARCISATALDFHEEFDAAFSNAALHWNPRAEQPIALTRIYASLKPGARFVAEMGGHGNIAAIRSALSVALAQYGLDAEALAASFYPSPACYTGLLEEAGFAVTAISLISRPTALPGGENGMEIWLNTFRNGALNRLPPEHRARAVTHTVNLLRNTLSDGAGSWTADYVRLRFSAARL